MSLRSQTLIVFLAGGLGTRSKNPSLPKVLQLVDNRLLLDFHFEFVKRNQFKNVSFLLGFKNNDVIDTLNIRNVEKLGLELNVRVDDKTDTQLSALVKHIRESDSRFQYFVVAMGDILMNVDILRYLDALQKSEKTAIALIRSNLHPTESDVAVIGNNKRVTALKLKNEPVPLETGPKKALAGLLILKRDSLQFCLKQKSTISEGLIKPLYDNNQIALLNTIEYLQDTGTEERLIKAELDVRSGAFFRKGTPHRAAIFLDRDGTIIPNQEQPRKEILRDEVRPELALSVRSANELGIPVFLVTNQPGIAKGLITEQEFLSTQEMLESYLREHKAIIDDFDYCPHYPISGFQGEIKSLKISCKCRKPAPGLLLKLAADHRINLSKSFFLGDSQADLDAAEAAGAKFLLCEDPKNNPWSTPEKIMIAVRDIAS